MTETDDRQAPLPATRAADVARLALDWHHAGRGAVVATVVETWGSAPRATGAQLVIDAAGAMEGSVSGGCVEGAVILEAQEALATGKAALLDYGVSDDDAFAVGLACGGRIRVLVEPVGAVLPVTVLEAVMEADAARRPLAVVRRLSGGDIVLGEAADWPDRFRLDRSGIEPDGDTFVAVHNPALRLVIVGAVHIAQPLVVIARLAGFDVTVIDPRPAFGAAARFPGTIILDDWPDAALAALGLDARTAIVTLTHDPKLDDPAVRAALASDVFYLGCLGSKRTHAGRIARLTRDGHTVEDIGRIHAPVGLDIGGRQPAEIAVSVMAQIIATLRQP